MERWTQQRVAPAAAAASSSTSTPTSYTVAKHTQTQQEQLAHQSSNLHREQDNAQPVLHAHDPLQSIANVLNHHHHHQRRAAQTRDQQHQQQQQQQQQQQHQGEQESSYLYAYNDIVTRAALSARAKSDSACQHAHQDLLLINHNSINEEQDDELDDTQDTEPLSYLLHQAHEAHCLSANLHLKAPGRYVATDATSQQADTASYETHIIDHHLSCSRNSHPRHICGIGGSRNEHTSHIAARLKEESRRAFLLNQPKPTSGSGGGGGSGGNSGNNFARNKLEPQFTHAFAHLQSTESTSTSTQTSSPNIADPYLQQTTSGSTASDNSSERQTFFLASPATAAAAAAVTNKNKGLSSEYVSNPQIIDSQNHLSIVGNKTSTSGHQQHELLHAAAYSSSSNLSDSRQTSASLYRANEPLTRQSRGANNHNNNNNSFGLIGWLFLSLANLLGSHQGQVNLTHAAERPAHRSNARNKRQRASQQQHLHTQAAAAAAAAAAAQQALAAAAAYAEPPNLGPHTTASANMYTTSHHTHQNVAGDQLGQPGAYYSTGQMPSVTAQDGLHHPHHHTHHHMHHSHSSSSGGSGNNMQQHHNHYPISSDSSMGSGSAFASSALRMNAFVRNCCSRKCLFVSCVSLILLIFIFVIGLTAYLNFLINANKTSLTPLSGRLKVETQGDLFQDQLANLTSKEFVAKRLQYETILRGAFDRTQSLLKTYPNHLVKCEVYSFKPGSLWVYFRLFVNKRTLLQDAQLMKRKSPDEQFDKQFLPRLTQQTLLSGFEQLITSSPSSSVIAQPPPPLELRRSRSSQTGELHRPARANAQQQQHVAQAAAQQQQDHVKSFDEQISRLMPVIESIDLQSIQVTPEFDMLQTNSAGAAANVAMSDNLRASQLLTTTTSSAVMVATGANAANSSSGKQLPEYELGAATSSNSSAAISEPTAVSSSTPAPAQPARVVNKPPASDEVVLNSNKFTLVNYKDSTTRPQATPARPAQDAPPSTSARPNLAEPSSEPSVFLTPRKPQFQQQQQPPAPKPIVIVDTSMRPQQVDFNNNKDKVIKLISGQPVVSQNPRTNLATSGNNNNKLLISAANVTLFAPLSKLEQAVNNATANGRNNRLIVVTNEPSGNMQMIAPYQKSDFNASVAVSPQPSRTQRPAQIVLTPDTSIQELWNNALNNQRKNATNSARIEVNSQPQQQQQQQQQQPKRLITVTTINADRSQPTELQANNNSADWRKISILGPDISNAIRAQMNASLAFSSTTPATATSSPQRPKVSPHLKHGGSLVSTTSQQQLLRQEDNTQPQSAVVLNKDFAVAKNEGNNQTPQRVSQQQQQQQQFRTDNKPKVQQTIRTDNSIEAQRTRAAFAAKPAVSGSTATSTNATQPAKRQKLKNNSSSNKMAANAQRDESVNASSNASKGIRIVDNFLATLDADQSNGSGGGNNNKTLLTTISTPANAVSSIRSSANANSGGGGGRFAVGTNASSSSNEGVGQPHTQPTTIELTRSTTSLPPARTRASGDSSETSSPVNADFSTTSTTQRTTPSGNLLMTTTSSTEQPASVFVPSSSATPVVLIESEPPPMRQLNQWRPVSNATNDAAVSVDNRRVAATNRTLLARKPTANLSLIISSERQPPMPNVPSGQGGSQSPFAMSPTLLETQPVQPRRSHQQQHSSRQSGRTVQKLSNTYQTGRAGNDFESHRVSRMRQGQAHSSSSSSTTASSRSSDARVINDFIVTTDINVRTLSTAAPGANTSPAQQAPSPQQPPRRTRGPFAFETLRSATMTTPLDLEFAAELSTAAAAQQPDNLPRSERSSRLSTEPSSLVRKKLLVGDATTDLSASPSTEPSVVIPTTSFNDLSANFNADDEEDDAGGRETDAPATRFGNRNSTTYSATRNINNNSTPRPQMQLDCVHHGCVAKGSFEYVCLNQTQICDDIIDCNDESDELDCVSLLKYDAQQNKLEFSAGDGIIYLKRRGSLAPMCIDYFTNMDNIKAQDLNSSQLSAYRKQQELIRQISTVGQYVCTMHSFARLASVKINHHTLIDNANLIKSAKLFHRLSIVSESDKRDRSQHDKSAGTYRSGVSEHEVEISTATDCPSQRTVFVKCGGFAFPNIAARPRHNTTQPVVTTSTTTATTMTSSLSSSASANETCNWFQCSSGECLPWSRICDGLYDCSSQEDEKDCHK